MVLADHFLESRRAALRIACAAVHPLRTWRRHLAARKGLAKGQTSEDGLFTLNEVECLGACANAPMVQINDDNYEDLTFETTTALLEALARGETPKPGPQGVNRRTSDPEGGVTSLPEMVGENHDYRGQWS